MYKILSFLLACSLAISSIAQSEDSVFIKRISDEILTKGKAYDDLHYLTKQIGGRLSGSPQMVKAELWGKQTMDWLKPDKVWLQECMVPHWVRGGKDGAYVIYNEGSQPMKQLDVIALGNSVRSGTKGIIGSVIEVHNYEE